MQKVEKEYYRFIEKLFRQTPRGRLLDGDGFYKKSFSQHLEDLILCSLMQKPADYRGFYVDVGALHPFALSNTAYFYLTGWSGINIEPDYTAIQHFNTYRKRDINVQVGVSREEKLLNFYVFDIPAYNTFDYDRAISYEKSASCKIIREEIVKTMPLEKILRENINKEQNIDFMDIDVEGLELEVLQSNNWIKYRPYFLLIETSKSDNNVLNFLNDVNYEAIISTELNIIFKDMENKNL